MASRGDEAAAAQEKVLGLARPVAYGQDGIRKGTFCAWLGSRSELRRCEGHLLGQLRLPSASGYPVGRSFGFFGEQQSQDLPTSAVHGGFGPQPYRLSCEALFPGQLLLNHHIEQVVRGFEETLGRRSGVARGQYGCVRGAAAVVDVFS